MEAKFKTLITKQELKDLYWNEELSQKEIAALFEIDRRTLRRRMALWGIPSRPSHGPRLERSKRKISEANTGKRRSKEWKKKLSERLRGDKNPAKIPKVREKISIALKGRKLTDGWKAKLSRIARKRTGVLSPRYGKHLSEETKEKIRNSEYHCNLKGENHPHWKGGHELYYGPNWQEQRRKARERDKHTCQLCDKTRREIGKEIDVHHIVAFREFGLERYKEANKLSNLITFCHSCHIKVENGSVMDGTMATLDV